MQSIITFHIMSKPQVFVNKVLQGNARKWGSVKNMQAIFSENPQM